MKTTAFTQKHIDLGAKMVEFAGYNMPVEYVGIKDEHMAVRENVGVFDVSHMGEIFVSGPDAEKFVNHIFSNDISGIPDGKILYGMMAATMIFATSCENELELGAAGEESVVSFTIATPDMGSRAYSDGTTATVLQYAVYEGETEFAIDTTITKGESFLFAGKELTEAGVYTDSLVNQYGCDSVVVLTLTVEEPPIVGLENAELVELVLTPNPVQVGEELLINATFSAEELDGMVVEVFNSVGQCVYTSQPAVAPIAITGLPQAGVYMVRVMTENGVSTRRITVVK